MARSKSSLPDDTSSGRGSSQFLGATSSSGPVSSDSRSWLSASSPVVAVTPSHAPSRHQPSAAAGAAPSKHGTQLPVAFASIHSDTRPCAKRTRAAEWLYTDTSSRPSQYRKSASQPMGVASSLAGLVPSEVTNLMSLCTWPGSEFTKLREGREAIARRAVSRRGAAARRGAARRGAARHARVENNAKALEGVGEAVQAAVPVRLIASEPLRAGKRERGGQQVSFSRPADRQARARAPPYRSPAPARRQTGACPAPTRGSAASCSTPPAPCARWTTRWRASTGGRS